MSCEWCGTSIAGRRDRRFCGVPGGACQRAASRFRALCRDAEALKALGASSLAIERIYDALPARLSRRHEAALERALGPYWEQRLYEVEVERHGGRTAEEMEMARPSEVARRLLRIQLQKVYDAIAVVEQPYLARVETFEDGRVHISRPARRGSPKKL